MTEYLKSCDLSATHATTVVTVEAEGEEGIIIIAEEGTFIVACNLLG